MCSLKNINYPFYFFKKIKIKSILICKYMMNIEEHSLTNKWGNNI